MAEQTEKAFLKQPKFETIGEREDARKGEVTGSGRALGWVSKLPERPLKGHTLTRNGHLLALCRLEAVFLRVHAIYSAKMQRTIIVRRNYLHYIKKYQRYEKRHSNLLAQVSPAFRVKEGDHVIIGQCRPLSKRVRFSVLKVIPAGSSAVAGNKAFIHSHLI